MATNPAQPTVILAHAHTLVGAEAFLQRLQETFGPLLIVSPDGQAPAGFEGRKAPWLGRSRWLRGLGATRFLRIGDAPRWALPEGTPTAWLNAPTDAPCDGLAAVFHAADGDPLLNLPAAPPLADANPLCERFRELREADRWVLYFAATVAGEEALAYGAFFELLRRRKGFMALAPADPERYEPVYRDAIKYRLPTNRHNRLSTSWIPKKSRVYYVEDPQTLDGLYDCVDVVVPGGTLVGDERVPDLATPLGRGCAVVVGPAQRDHPLVATAVAAGAVAAADNENGLVDTLLPLLCEPEARESLARRGREWLERQGGAADRVLEALVTATASR